jgi:large subunit ribosomal protein L23
MSVHLYKIIQAPHISEKAALAAEAGNQVVFKVAVDATKPEIKKSN